MTARRRAASGWIPPRLAVKMAFLLTRSFHGPDRHPAQGAAEYQRSAPPLLPGTQPDRGPPSVGNRNPADGAAAGLYAPCRRGSEFYQGTQHRRRTRTVAEGAGWAHPAV